MKKILLWFVSKDTGFLHAAIDTLTRQHNSVEIIGMATGEEFVQVDGGGGATIFCSSSAQSKSA